MGSSLILVCLKRSYQSHVIRPSKIHTMAPVLYGQYFSPPTRGVLLTAAALGVKLELRIIDLSKKKQRSGEFVKVSSSSVFSGNSRKI